MQTVRNRDKEIEQKREKEIYKKMERQRYLDRKRTRKSIRQLNSIYLIKFKKKIMRYLLKRSVKERQKVRERYVDR